MRNIMDYEKQYLDSDFELMYQVKYRRKKVVDIVSHFPHAKILEVGCGIECLVKYIRDVQEYTVVEPSHYFITKAQEALSEFFMQGGVLGF